MGVTSVGGVVADGIVGVVPRSFSFGVLLAAAGYSTRLHAGI